MSHESIYRTLFVQSRGALRKELTALPAHRAGDPATPRESGCPTVAAAGRTSLHISERPAEVEDRAVPGHWEGDLVFGKGMSPVATLVERSTRFLMLVALPRGNHKADAVADALAAAVTTLPTAAGQVPDLGPGPRDGPAPAVHHRHRVQVYFCDPKSPWQRGSNENTNGLLRQYLPRRLDFRTLTQDRLRRHRPRAQRTTSTDPRLQDTITSTSRGVALTA